MQRAFFVIYNPVAGGGLAARRIRHLEAMLQDAQATFMVEATSGPGEATRLAWQAVWDEWPVVIALGGDGTINEVVNGLMQAEDEGYSVPLLGVVPAGSGNDFVKVLGLYRRPMPFIVQTLLEAPVRYVDVARANGRYLLNGLGWGFDGYVAAAFHRSRWLKGFPAYLWAVLKVLRQYRTAEIRLMIDERPPQQHHITMIAITNGACYGGGFWICPHALADDGVLDIAIAEAMGPLEIMLLLPRVIRGTHVGHPRVAFEHGLHIRLESEIPLPAHVDGEVLGTALTHIDVTLFAKRLAVLAASNE